MSRKRQTKSSPIEKKPIFIETHWDKIIILLLFLLPLIYFGQFLNADRMIAGSDYLIGGYPFEKWIAGQKEMPLWYPHVFGGVPVLGAPVGGPLAPLAQLREIIAPNVVLVLSFIIFFFLAGLGMYLYLKAIGLSPYAAAVGAVIYQFIGNLATTPAAGHAGRAASIAIFPLMLFFIHSALRSKKLIYFLCTALVTAFAFYEGHFQITYYGLLFILGYVIYYLIARRKEHTSKDIIKIFGYGIFTVLLICLIMAAVWLPVLSGLGTAARGVERGYEYATSWAMPTLELVDLFIPTFSGILNNYWGMNSFKIHLEYFGMIAFIFSFFTILLFWKKPYVKFYTISTIIVILIALGDATPFFRIPYLVIPGFKLFRAPALIFYLVSFCIIVLGAIGFDNIMKKQEDQPKKKIYLIGIIIIALFLILGIIFAAGGDSMIRSMQDSIYPKLIKEWGQQAATTKITKLRTNYSDLVSGVWRSLLFIVIIISMIYLSIKKGIKIWIVATIAIVMTLIDQLPLVSKFLRTAPAPKVYYAADDVVGFLKRDKDIFRVFPTPWYEHATDLYLLYHNIQSAGGYIPNPLKRYQEFIGAGESVMFTPSNLIQYPKFLDLLNAKYIIAPTLPQDVSQYDPQTQRTIQQIRSYLSRYLSIFVGRRYTVYENQHAIPRVYLVHEYAVHDESDMLEIMKSETYNPLHTVLLEEDPGVVLHLDIRDDFIPGAAQLVKYTPNEITCQVQSDNPGFLVLADNWHPDWQAFVNGVKSKIYVANHTFRAVYVQEGVHEVVFRYISNGFNTGSTVSIVALILALGICVVGLKYRI